MMCSHRRGREGFEEAIINIIRCGSFGKGREAFENDVHFVPFERNYRPYESKIFFGKKHHRVRKKINIEEASHLPPEKLPLEDLLNL